MNTISPSVAAIHGVRLVQLQVFRDERGDLLSLDEAANLPFPFRRAFYVKGDDAETVRSGHAASADLLVTPVFGSAILDVDNGHESRSLRLDTPGRAVWTRPGIFITLRDLARSSVLLVCASRLFGDTRYFGAPQPAMIDAPDRA